MRNLPLAVCVLLLTVLMNVPAWAGDPPPVRTPGVLQVAVYSALPPFSENGRGLDVEIAGLLAAKLGLKLEVLSFEAGDDVGDDLRNMVWRGHYLRGAPADLLMHVPVDPLLAKKNPQVVIVAPYYREQLAALRSLRQMPSLVGLEAFAQVKTGVEGDSLAHQYLIGALGGRLAGQVAQFKTVGEAVAALRSGELGAVLGTRSQIEAAGPTAPGFELTPFAGAGLAVSEWSLGVAVKSDNPELAAAVEAAMASLEREGALREAFARYGIGYRSGQAGARSAGPSAPPAAR